ncbi:hypothetical protein I6N91_11105 [Arthrobacter sp. MSA 4-2]|uniref:hypothetical protein n=1 Tax=Arthrobacter sp. MSA 4-2 TaxID=2794349 RepID=UPI0018E7F53C|nr:hypothetical protein [Arthrobacter sp. MSA 4-2]MBJ2121525.1 hypothetical protein [Arthrobacter sp. MSA 4-2]
MGLEAEAFYIDGRRTGALVRETGGGALRTTVAFLLPDGHLVHLTQETRYGSDVLGWTSYSYVDHGSDVDITGVPADDAGGAAHRSIPSYAAHLLLVQALRAGKDRVAFSQFIEDGDGTALGAVFAVRGRETVETPWGRQEALKVLLEVEGEPRNTFWWDGDRVVRTDWQGGTSYAAHDLPLLLSGLDARVRSALDAALSPPARAERGTGGGGTGAPK